MTKDLDDLLEEQQKEMFDEDTKESEGMDPALWTAIQYIIAILILVIAIALLLHFHGDKLAGLLNQIKEMMDVLQNPTGFTP